MRGSTVKHMRQVGIVNFSVESALRKEVTAAGGSTSETWYRRSADMRHATRQMIAAELAHAC